MKYSKLEVSLGALILLLVVVAIFRVFVAVGFFDISNHNEYNAVFSNAKDINIGTDIRISGVKVGKVKDIKFDTENFTVNIKFSLLYQL